MEKTLLYNHYWVFNMVSRHFLWDSLLLTWGERYPFGYWDLFLFSLLEIPFKLADAECVQRISYLLVSLLFLFLTMSPNGVLILSFHSLWHISNIELATLFLENLFPHFLPEGTLLVFLWYHWMPLFSFLFFFYPGLWPQSPVFLPWKFVSDFLQDSNPPPPQPSLMYLFSFFIIIFILSL